MKQMVILAGGRGSRMGGLLGALPKPMAPVGGKPLLRHQLELGLRHGFTEAVLLTGHGGETLESALGSVEGMRLRYVREERPLGTAGALMQALPVLAERFLVLYGDTLLEVDLERMWSHHQRASADLTLFLHPNDHPQDSDLVEVDEEDRVVAFHAPPHPPERLVPNLANAALYVMERRVLQGVEAEGMDLARTFFPRLLARGARLVGYRSPEYIKDMGTPERYARVQADHASGRPQRCSLEAPRPAVLLDRDGTLNRHAGYVRRPEEVELLDGVGAALRRLNQAGLRTALVTNQPVVARGECTEQELRRIHSRLELLLGRQGAYLDRLYWCPHHPDGGFAGERPELKKVCDCRKPATGLIERAARELRLELGDSWMVGDTTVDVRTARQAGVRSVLLRTGEAGSDARFPDRPDYVFLSLTEAVEFILVGHAALRARLEPLARDIPPGAWVGVGGLAHAGKSTTSSVLREVLRAQGRAASIVSLDNWIRSVGQRRADGLADNFDYEAIEDALGRLRRGERVDMPWYDRATRTRRDPGESLRLEPGEVLIIEGVPALDVPWLQPHLALKLYVEAPEPERLTRFLRDRSWRGQDETTARALYQSREGGEHPLVRATRACADVVLGVGG
ncbi:HAD-IIIA family hydrolase [Archangium violaceum]|uniref:HAD-IIIA family hydrolase n=1 Tax=Archangium violaceum TaxID=83451 RepID=UPI00195220EC|nr:HAD-IIIA family hydrolase [Archangium violaceum]QRN99079.1 HAD-IIIA family hydrolase [Archangium violaceum]